MSFIETERLLLRTWMLPSDLDDAVELFTDEDAQRFYIRGSLKPENVSAYVQRLVEKDEREGFGVWPVIEKESHSLVGAAGLSRVADLGGDVEVEWVFKAASRGKGYAKEAARAVLQYAFSHAGISRVCALIDPGNTASITIANRLGMRFDRVVRAYRRDLLRYTSEAP